MDILENKTILLLSVQTFDIENQIINKLSEYKANIIYFDERPKNNFYIKSILRLYPNLIKKRTDSYYLKILSEVTEINIDYLLVIRGEVVPRWFLKKLRKSKPKTRFIFYTWDSFYNNPNGLNNLDLYDSKLSFDSNDCLKYKLQLRPLFFNDLFDKDRLNIESPIKHTFSFIGTIHSDRFQVFKKIKSIIPAHNSAFGFFYIQNLLVYFFRLVIERSIKWIPINFISFKSLSQEKVRNVYLSSKFILDINHPHQVGLTMRTFEAIGLNKKLITTNQHIKIYKFYNPELIIVLDRNNLDIDSRYFKKNENETEYNNLNKFRSRLTVEGWIRSVFINCEHIDFWIT